MYNNIFNTKFKKLYDMNKKQKNVFQNLETIHPEAANAYARLLQELPYKRKKFYTPVIAHCARELLNLLTRNLNVIRNWDDIRCFLHATSIDFDTKELFVQDDKEIYKFFKKNKIEPEEKPYCLSVEGRYILFLLKYHSPKLTYNTAKTLAKKIKNYNFHKYAHANDGIPDEEYKQCVSNIFDFIERLTGIRKMLVTDLTDEVDMFANNCDEVLLQKLIEQIKLDLFLKNYFYKKLTEDASPERFFNQLKKYIEWQNAPIFSEQSNGSYINYPWDEGEYLFAIINRRTYSDVVKILIDIQQKFFINTTDEKLNFWFVDTYLKLLLKLYSYVSNFSVESLVQLFEIVDKISLGMHKQEFLDVVQQIMKKNDLDSAIKILEILCKINWRYTSYTYVSYKTYNFHHSTVLNEYEYELLLEKMKYFFQNDQLVFVKLLLRILFKYNLEWPKDVQDAFKHQIISRSTIENHEQTGPATNLIEKLFVFVRDVSLELPIEQIETELRKYRDWPIANRLLIYLISENDNVELAKKYLINKQNLQSSQCYHEYYWLLKKHFNQLSSKDQQRIYALIQNFSNSFKENDLRKHVLINRLAIIEDYLNIKYRKIFNQLKKQGILPRTECPDFLSYSIINDTTTKTEIPRKVLLTFDELKEMLINNSIDTNSWHIPDNISKVLRAYILEHYNDIFQNLTSLVGISSAYYYDIFETLSKVSNTFTYQNFKHVLNYITLLLDRNKSHQLCASISNFFRLCIADTKLKDILTQETVTNIQHILLKIIRLPDLAMNERFEQYKKDPIDVLNQAINDPAGVAFECMILICEKAKENEIAYDIQKLEASFTIVLRETYLGLICRSLIGLHLGWLYQNHRSWCLAHKDKLFHRYNYLFLSTMFGLINYRNATLALYPYLEDHLKRLLYIEIPHSSMNHFGYYLLFYYLNDKIALHNSTTERLSMYEIFSIQPIRNNIFWHIHHIFCAKISISKEQMVKIKKLLDFYTLSKLENKNDRLDQYERLYQENWFASEWFVRRYAIWSKHDNFYRKPAWFWEKLTSKFNPSLQSEYLNILNNLFRQQDRLDFDALDFEKLYNFISILSCCKIDINQLKSLLDIMIRKLCSEKQRETLRVLYSKF